MSTLMDNSGNSAPERELTEFGREVREIRRLNLRLSGDQLVECALPTGDARGSVSVNGDGEKFIRMERGLPPKRADKLTPYVAALAGLADRPDILVRWNDLLSRGIPALVLHARRVRGAQQSYRPSPESVWTKPKRDENGDWPQPRRTRSAQSKPIPEAKTPEEKHMQEFGKILREIRLAAGKSQLDLAKGIGLGLPWKQVLRIQTTVSSLERGRVLGTMVEEQERIVAWYAQRQPRIHAKWEEIVTGKVRERHLEKIAEERNAKALVALRGVHERRRAGMTNTTVSESGKVREHTKELRKTIDQTNAAERAGLADIRSAIAALLEKLEKATS